MSRVTLLLRLILRPLWRERTRTLLSVAAVTLGVAVVIAIQLSGEAAAGSFHSSLQSLSTKADFDLTAVGGLDERILASLVVLPYPLRISPRLEDFALVESTGESVPVIGLDLVSEASRSDFQTSPDLSHPPERDVIWTTRRLAAPGGTLRLTINDHSSDFLVQGMLDTPDDIIVMDIAPAQRIMGKLGRLDRIQIELPSGSTPSDYEPLLRRAIPANVALASSGAETEENRKMLAAFRWNLTILSYIALVVGAFLIYNNIAVAVVRRRPEIGIVRALGATRSIVLGGFLAEAAMFGLIGGLLGVILGRLLAIGAVRLLGATVESLYVSSRPAPIAITPSAILLALMIGIGVTLVAALAPAIEASRVAPVEAMARGRQEHKARLHTGRNFAIAALLLSCAAVAAQGEPVWGKPIFGYFAAALVIAAGAFAIPGAIAISNRALSRLVHRALGIEATLAFRSLVASLSRTSVLVGALATAVAMMASVGIMVGSFRETVALWMDNQLLADFYLRPAGPAAADRHPTLSIDLANEVARLPEVAAVDGFRAYPIAYNGLPATLAGADTAVHSRFGHTSFLPGEDRARIMADLPRGDNVIVSEPFANKHHVHVGDVISLPLNSASHSFKVLGIFYDYSSERGYVLMDLATLHKYLPDPNLSNFAVFLRPGVDPDAVRAALDRVCARRSVLIFSHRSLRREALRVFDRTFAITYALEIVAVVVAIMGVAGALLALVIDRRREFGLLRFLGAAGPQVCRLILFEAGFLGLLANAIGLGLGILLSLDLIYVINKQSFGWTIQFHWPVSLLIGALSLVYAATILSALYPARTAVRLNPIEVVHEE